MKIVNEYEIPEKEPPHACEDCGIELAIEKRECPYNKQMGGFSRKIWLCDRCYDQRAADV